MTVLEAISSIESKLRRNHIVSLAIIIAALISYQLLLVCLLALAVSKFVALAFLIAAGFAVIILSGIFFKRAKDFRDAACLLLDTELSTKERIVSFAELNTSKVDSDQKKLNFLNKQIAPFLGSESLNQVARLKLSRREKGILYSFPVIWVLILLMLFHLFSYKESLNPSQSALLNNLIEKAKDLPPEVTTKLEELAQTLKDHELSDADVEDKLEDADNSIIEAQANEKEAKSVKGATSVKEKSQKESKPSLAATATPTPTATATSKTTEKQKDEDQKQQDQQQKDDENKQDKSEGSDKSKSEQQGKSRDDVDVQNSASSKSQDSKDAKKSQGGDGSGEGEQGKGEGQKKGEGSDSQNKEGGQSGKGDNKEQNGQGQGENNSQQKDQGGSQDSKNEASSNQNQSAQGGQQDKSSDSKNSDNKQSGSESSKNEQKEKNQQGKDQQGKDQKGGEQGKSPGNQLAQAKAALDQIKQDMQSKQKESQGNQGNNAGQEKSDKESKEKDQKQGKDTGKADSKAQQSKQQGEKGDTGNSQGDSKKPGEKPNENKNDSASQKKNASNGNTASSDSNDSESKDKSTQQSSNKNPQPSSIAPKEQQVSERDLKGDGGKGLGDNKAFKDVQVNPQTEKYDTRYLEQEGRIVRHDKESNAKTNLSDVELAKPEAQRDESQQQIPLEYKDLLR